MIVVNNGARAPYATIFVTGLSLDFVWRPEVGFSAIVDDAHPLAADVRAKVAALPMYEILEGGEAPSPAERPRVYVTTPTPDPTPAPVAPAPVLSGRHPILARAALNGWSDADMEGVGQGGRYDAEGGYGACGLTGITMSLTNPPPGWTPRVAEADPYPWEMPGWRPVDGFVPPIVRQRVVEPPAPEADPVEERFTDAPAAEATADVATDDDGPALQREQATDEQRELVAQGLVANEIAPDIDTARKMVLAALETPAASTGAPPSRGKVNLTLRNRKLPQIRYDADFSSIQAIL